MEIIQSENYEAINLEFQFQVIQLLNEAWVRHNLPLKLRKEICGDFTFDLSMLLDQGEVNNTIPTVAFIADNKVLFRNEEFEYHEYAFGNVDEVFDAR